ncbi:GspH/FimT family pseudopilin [Desulfatirhabdium butyrativorans]|uniref:GspH/FimT family pseudopilin n=1 Tax=Desulfatirhabdium butyrativorans TaxID=340467 RepID=UPI00146FC555|nr:GspH/FimT family protein [Desulfatirhabdium butyrativorans]
MGRRNTEGGFTLIELVVVLVLLALSAGLVFQHAGGKTDVRQAKVFAQELASFLKKARRTAVNTGGPVTVWISESEGTCSMDEAHIEIPEAVQIEDRNVRQDEDGVPYVRFDPDGGSSGGELIVRTGGNAVAVLRIDLFTGAIQALREAADITG